MNLHGRSLLKEIDLTAEEFGYLIDLAAQLRQHWRDRLGDDHENTREAATYLARALRDMGRYAEARELDEDTLAHRRQMLGDDHPYTASSLSHLADAYRQAGRTDEAIALLNVGRQV